MKSLHRHLLAAGLLASIGIGAFAQAQTAPVAPSGPGPAAMEGHRMDPARMEQFRAHMQERRAKRLGTLKQKLQITPAQEGAWNAWTAALQPVSFQRPDRAEFARLTTPERIDRMRALRAQHEAEQDKRADATKALYAALNPEQKQTFDKVSLRMLGGHHRHGGWGQRGENGPREQR